MRRIVAFVIAIVVLAGSLCLVKAELNEISVKIFPPEFLSSGVFFKAVSPTQDPLSKDPLTVKSLDFYFILNNEKMKLKGQYSPKTKVATAKFNRKCAFKEISAVWVDVSYKESGVSGYGYRDMVNGFSCQTDQVPRHRSYTVKEVKLTDSQLVVKFITNPVTGWDVVTDKTPNNINPIKMIWLETSEWVGVHYNKEDVEPTPGSMVRSYAKWDSQEKLWVCRIRYTTDDNSEFPAWHEPVIFTSVINKIKTVKEKWFQSIKISKQ